MSFKEEIKIIGLKEIPLIKEGDNISDIIIKALDRNGLTLQKMMSTKNIMAHGIFHLSCQNWTSN